MHCRTGAFVLSLVCVLLLVNRAHSGEPSEALSLKIGQDTTTPQDPGEEYSLKWYTMFTNIPADLVRFTDSTFQSGNIPTMIGIAGSTGVLLATDNKTWRISHRLYTTSPSIQHTSDFFEYLGDGRPQFGLAGAFALYGISFGDRRAVSTGSQLIEAFSSCGIVVQVMKHVTGRQAPLVSTEPGGDWDFFPNQIKYNKHVPSFDSYPSGHIATAMTTLTVIAENYPECVWLKPVGYTVVGLIGMSLANTGVHWYSDLPMGLSLGYAFGKLAAHPQRENQSLSEPRTETNFSIIPELSRRGPGIMLAASF